MNRGSAVKLGSLCAVVWTMPALAMAGDVVCLEIRPEKTRALAEAAREGRQQNTTLPSAATLAIRHGR